MKKDDLNGLIYIENNCRDPHYNLAFEEYVFTKICSGGKDGRPLLLLWQNEPSVIIGKYQNTAEEINYEYISRHNINVVRRNTGGGAVYHDDGNLNYSFIIPDVESKVDFKTFTIPIVKALQSRGVKAEQTGRNDILVDGCKFSGNAQQFSDRKLLHHGTLMFDVNVEAVAGSLQVKEGKFKSKASKSVRSRVTNLKPYLKDQGVDTAEKLKELLLEWFKTEYDVAEMQLTQEQLSEIEELRRNKYLSRDWNYGKSPKSDMVRGEWLDCGRVEFHISLEKHKISGVKIVGDFFATADVAILEEALVGVEYNGEDVLEALKKAGAEKIITGVKAEELANIVV